ncbi:hypothetical protein NQ317_000566 [Molorchus minor]|uniref:Uncharacterized protein n=1 Tax=Molorchus minor TaxID=1323400 RepID=A0ABQ9IT31_9CUCU|nr:hypothetical protein NQ317_000566 [Molorchus minor]
MSEEHFLTLGPQSNILNKSHQQWPQKTFPHTPSYVSLVMDILEKAAQDENSLGEGEVDHLTFLGKLKQCIRYLPTYNTSNVVEELLQHIMPVIKQCLQKLSMEFIQNVKVILDFLLENNDIEFCNLNIVSINTAEIIIFTFEHCRSSSDTYKTTFNTELLNIFRITQEVHLLFLKLLDSCVVMINPSHEDVRELNKEVIGNMSGVLFEISIKSMSDNWKGYISIIQKFSPILSEEFDMKLPIQLLVGLINKNLYSITNLEDVDQKFLVQVVKIVGFSADVQKSHSGDYQELLETTLYKPMEPFLLKLANDAAFEKILADYNSLNGDKLGFVILLSKLLNLIVLNENRPPNLRIGLVLSAIFYSVAGYTEFYLESWPMMDVFDNLVLNVTASVLIYDDYYAEVESILIDAILQQHIWSALLAIEVWTLLLHNSTPQTCLETIYGLLRKYEDIEFGKYTYRLEEVYIKCFIQRIFNMLPLNIKNQVVNSYNPMKNIHIWNAIKFHKIPIQQRSVIEDISSAMFNTVQSMDEDDFSVSDISFLINTLELLSSVELTEMGISAEILVIVVCNLWEANYCDIIDNNIFKRFMKSLCKITRMLVPELNNRQIFMVLTQLRFLSNEDFYTLLVCEVLSSLSRQSLDKSQDAYKITTKVSEICTNLLSYNNNVIKQNILEIIQHFSVSGKHDIVKNIMRTANDMQSDISNYLQRNNNAWNNFDKEYLTLLATFKYRHLCMMWKNNTHQPCLKNPK